MHRDAHLRRLMIRDSRVVEACLRDLLDSMPDASFLVDSTGRFVLVNALTEAMLGYASGELPGKSVATVIPERFRGAHASHCSDYLTRPRTRAMGAGITLRASRKDGSEVPVEISLSPVETDRGIYVIGAIRDVSQSEDRYRAIFEQTGVGVVYSNSKGRILDVNQKFSEVSGYAYGEALALSIRELTHHDDTGSSLQARAQLLAGNRSTYEKEIRFIRKDGTEIWTHTTTSLIRGTGGRPLHFLSLIQDINSHKQAEEEKREIALRFRQVTENIREVFWLVDTLKNEMLYVSPAYEEIWGRNLRELYLSPSDWLDAVHAEDRDRVLLATQTKQFTGDYDEEYRIVRPDGEVRWIRDRAFPVYEDSKVVRVAGVAEDITARIRAEEEIRRHVAQLKTAFMSAVEVATTLSEMRDPYTAGHERRVAGIAVAIATELGLDVHQQEGLEVAGRLHDIGKITIPAEILAKPGRLTTIEYQLVQGHPRAGYEVLKRVEFPWPVAEVALQHHERMDGSGYPQGLKGKAILLEARIVAVADVVEAMSSHRPYRPGLGIEKALAEIGRGRGTIYDPDIVDACLRLFQEKRYELA